MSDIIARDKTLKPTEKHPLSAPQEAEHHFKMLKYWIATIQAEKLNFVADGHMKADALLVTVIECLASWYATDDERDLLHTLLETYVEMEKWYS